MLLPFVALNRSVQSSRAAHSLWLNCIVGTFFTGLSLSLFLAWTMAQEPAQEDIIRVRTDLVAVPVIVTDSRGRRVPDLKREDFVLTDDNRAAKIGYFASGAERVALLFALDVSGSARDILAQQRE